jgi:hypothetical protein
MCFFVRKILPMLLLSFFGVLIFVYFFPREQEGVSENFDDDFFDYHYFVHPDGLFSFYYKNNYVVRNEKEIYFLHELRTGNVPFQVFENTSDLQFNQEDFECVETNGREICYTFSTPDHIVKNFDFYPDIFWENRILLNQEFISRGEAIAELLKIRYPDKDFSVYADNCFSDISPSHVFSGEICFAKRERIVSGRDNKVSSEDNVKFSSMLLMSSRIFGMGLEDMKISREALDFTDFSIYQRNHPSFDVVYNALYFGLLHNIDNERLSPNPLMIRFDDDVRRYELDQFVSNLLYLLSGKKIRDYFYDEDFVLDNNVYVYGDLIHYSFESANPDNFDPDPSSLRAVRVVQKDSDVYAYFRVAPNLYEYLYKFHNASVGDFENIILSIDETRILDRTEFLVEYVGDVPNRRYVVKVDPDQFLYLKTIEKHFEGLEHLLPKNISPPELGNSFVPSMKLFMSNENFNALRTQTRLNARYPAWLEIHYPDGVVQGTSVLIKIRGNSSRSDSKFSLTVEAFDEFQQNPNFSGDDFLHRSNEFKLRNFIRDNLDIFSDYSLIREQLFYFGFEQLGYPSPQFFNATLEINNRNFGFYQVTEAIKSNFFRKRDINVGDYFYPLNFRSHYRGDLNYLDDDDTTLDHYRVKQDSDAQVLLDFILALENNDPNLIEKIDKKNVFDYAMYAYMTTALDSWVHNYYLYKDLDDGLWKVFFWDGDTTFLWAPTFSKTAFLKSLEERSNNLIAYVFDNITDEEFDDFYRSFMSRWRRDVNLTRMIDVYLIRYADFFRYDNLLWQEIFLQKNPDQIVDTIKAVRQLRGIVNRL